MQRAPGWPDLTVARWAATKKSVHLYTQMLGKIRVALSPAQPNWLFTALLPNARGVTTGPIPYGGRAIEASLDVFTSELVVARSDGQTRRVRLLPVRTVADVYADLQAALRALDVACVITTAPQEIPDTTPLHEDRRPGAYDPAAVERWFRVITATAGIFDTWRAHFFGRTGIQLWWGALDLSLMLFNGKHVTPPADRGYLMKYDLDAELMNAGFYPGDDANAPYFYAYIYPQPANAATLAVAGTGAAWSATINEWTLPYETMRTAGDPAAELHAFLDSIYALCVSHAGWDAAALSYQAPKRTHQG